MSQQEYFRYSIFMYSPLFPRECERICAADVRAFARAVAVN